MFACSRDGRDGAAMDINANENWVAALCLASPRLFTSLPLSLPRSLASQAPSLTCSGQNSFRRLCTFAALKRHTFHFLLLFG